MENTSKTPMTGRLQAIKKLPNFKTEHSTNRENEYLGEMVKMKAQMMEQEVAYNNANKKHEELVQIFQTHISKVQEEFQLLQDNDENVKRIALLTQGNMNLIQEKEELKKDIEDQWWKKELIKIIGMKDDDIKVRDIFEEIQGLVGLRDGSDILHPETGEVKGKNKSYKELKKEIEDLNELLEDTDDDRLIDILGCQHCDRVDAVEKLKKLVDEYEECSLRDLKATPEDLEDYQEELQNACEEKDEEISRLEDYEEAIDELRKQFCPYGQHVKGMAEHLSNLIWEKDSETDEVRDELETMTEDHGKLEIKLRVANKTMKKFRENIEMLKKEKGMMEKDNEEMKVAFSVVSSGLEMSKKMITRAENAEEVLDNLGYEYNEVKEWWETEEDADDGVMVWEVETEELRKKFNIWRELQQATNPQYSVWDEMGFLLGEDEDGRMAKIVFEDLNTFHKMVKNPKTGVWEIEDAEE